MIRRGRESKAVKEAYSRSDRSFLEAKAELAALNAFFEAARAGCRGLELALEAAELQARLIRELRSHRW